MVSTISHFDLVLTYKSALKKEFVAYSLSPDRDTRYVSRAHHPKHMCEERHARLERKPLSNVRTEGPSFLGVWRSVAKSKVPR